MAEKMPKDSFGPPCTHMGVCSCFKLLNGQGNAEVDRTV